MINTITTNISKNNYIVPKKSPTTKQSKIPKQTSYTYPPYQTLQGYYLTKSPRQINFRGTPSRLPSRIINGASDAIAQWDLLRLAKYSDVHDDAFVPYNKQIRLENYVFLDKLTSANDKKKFIEHFKEVTGFPNFGEVSNKMDLHFRKVISNAEKDLGNKFGKLFDIHNCSGFDPSCSVGLKRAFPGSDLDKGYIILGTSTNQGTGVSRLVYSYDDTNFINQFKGYLWENLDQRLVSLNHRETFPEVMTQAQFNKTLDFLDEKTKILINENGKETYIKLKNSSIKEPILAAQFNIDLAQKLDQYTYSGVSKDTAKNFAFFIESLQGNPSIKNLVGKDPKMYYNNENLTCQIANRINTSPFAELSNVTQTGAWIRKLDTGYRKQKLRNREEIEKNFNQWSVDEQYELVKDIIKASSDDHLNPEFDKYFTNDDDIKERFTPLITCLTK